MASIRARQRKDGSTAYAVLWREPGERKLETRTFDLEHEARTLKDFLDANGNTFALAVQAAADLRSQAPTVAEVVAESIDLVTGVEERTKHKYRQLAARHITPVLGQIPVDRLDRRRVLAWFEGIDLSAKSKANIQAVLSAGLTHAVERGLATENVAKGIRAPKTSLRTREPLFLAREQVDLLETALQDYEKHHALLVPFLAGSGLRYSEAAALRPGAIEERDGRMAVRVRTAWKEGTTGFYLGGPKSKKGTRTVVLPRSLEERVTERVGKTKPGHFLFGRPDGSALQGPYFHKEVWQPLLGRLAAKDAASKYGARLELRPGPQDLRHTHASWLIAAGVPLPVIQVRLGHESIQTTVNVYGHLATGADAAAADALD